MARKRKRTKKIAEVIYIFCEGESEEAYLNMLKQKYRLPNVKVRVVASDLSGERLVKKAIETMNYHHIKRGYVIFDRDEHKRSELEKCKKLADKNNISIIFSSIDFEIWILMHFEPVNRPYTRKELENKLSGKKYFNTDYKNFKGNSYRKFLFDKIEYAVTNANALYKSNNNWITDDPYTNVQIYIDEIFHPKFY